MSIAQAQAPSERLCQVVYGFVLGLHPNTVLGIEREDGWYLPGGVVEGRGTPDGAPIPESEYCGDPVRFAPLAWHVKQQTGLDLVGLSAPFQVVFSNIEDGIAVTMLYIGKAVGTQTGGTVIESDRIPEFAPLCGVKRDQIERFLKGLNPIAPPTPPTLWQKIKVWFRKPQ
jgi:hypothetical protein